MGERMLFPSKQLALAFLLTADSDDVWLSIRRRTPWQYCFSGLGGNFEEGEDRDFKDTVIRESEKEACITIEREHIEKRGEFKIFRDGKFVSLLHVVVVHHFEGVPTKTEEMGPHLIFPIAHLPYVQMPPGDDHSFWVERILRGEFLMGEMYRSADLETLLDIKVYVTDAKSLLYRQILREMDMAA